MSDARGAALRDARTARAPTWPARVAVSALSLDVVCLFWVGLTPVDLAVFLVFLAACIFAGALCLRGKHALFDDHMTFGLVCAALGLSLHMALCFLAFDVRVGRCLGIADRPTAARAVFGVLLALAVLGVWRLRGRVPALPACASPWAASVLFVLVSLVAGATHFAFGNDLSLVIHTRQDLAAGADNPVVARFFEQDRNPDFRPSVVTVPEWASRIDSLSHVWLIPRMIESHGLPGVFEPQADEQVGRIGEFQHVGFSLQLLGLVDIAGHFGAERSAALSKPLSLAWLWLMTGSLFAIARGVFKLGGRAASLAAAGGLFYSPINVTLVTGPNLEPTSALAYLATPVYWNLNHVAQLAVGLAGLLLVLLALAHGRRSFAIGCVLVAASLYYRPSFFFVAAPAIGLASLRLGARCLRADVWLGWLALLAALGFWFGYPRAHGLFQITSPIAFGFLERQVWYAREHQVLPPFLSETLGPTALALVILTLAHAALIPPTLDRMRSVVVGGAVVGRRFLATLARAEVLALVLLFVWGTFCASCLIEDNERREHNNFFSCGAAGGIGFLPLLVLAIGRIESRPLRVLGWFVYGAHIVSGAVNLWIYASTGDLS